MSATLASPAKRRRPTGTGGRRETVVFRAAAALIALYVVDDGAIHAEPGTGIGDHLVRMLVPLALLAASAGLYPRVRAGARAGLALVWGVLAATAGIADGLRHVAVDTLAGDDLTAMVAAAAGAALLVLGVVVLWRSRWTDTSLPRTLLRRALITVGAALAGFFVVLPMVFAVVGNHKAREPVAAVDLGRPAAAVTLTTSDGLELAGTYVPSRNGAGVLVFPGRTGPVDHARLLVDRGYGVLMIDRRGEGESEGDFSARGWGGEPDVRAALAYLRARPDVDPDRIGGLGLSVGGELLLQTAATDRTLRAVVSEGAGQRSLREQLHAPDAPSGLRWLSPSTVETAANMVLGGGSPPPDLAELMPRIAPSAVLLIRAQDGNADEELNTVYVDRAREPKALWTLPDGGHTGALDAQPEQYEDRVVGFFDEHLGP